MARTTRNRSSRGRRSGGRRFVWARDFANGLSVTTTGIQVNALGLFETAAGQNLLGATITRIRGIIHLAPVAAQTGPSRAVFAAMVSSAAEATASDGPISAPFRDWSMWEPFLFTDATTAPFTNATSSQRVIDVKSMRKLEEVNEQFTWWVQSDTDPYTVSYDLSIGLLLP